MNAPAPTEELSDALRRIRAVVNGNDLGCEFDDVDPVADFKTLLAEYDRISRSEVRSANLFDVALRTLREEAPNLSEITREYIARTIICRARHIPDSAQEARDPDGYNGCYRQAIAALNYLAQYPRPVGGQSQFNAEHLLQIADEMKRSRAPSVPSAQGNTP